MADIKDLSRTVFLGNLDGQVTEKLIYELGCQAGPVTEVKVQHDKDNKRKKSFAFIKYADLSSAIYCLGLYKGLLNLFGNTVNVNFANQPVDSSEVTDEDRQLLAKFKRLWSYNGESGAYAARHSSSAAAKRYSPYDLPDSSKGATAAADRRKQRVSQAANSDRQQSYEHSSRKDAHSSRYGQNGAHHPPAITAATSTVLSNLLSSADPNWQTRAAEAAAEAAGKVEQQLRCLGNAQRQQHKKQQQSQPQQQQPYSYQQLQQQQPREEQQQQQVPWYHQPTTYQQPAPAPAAYYSPPSQQPTQQYQPYQQQPPQQQPPAPPAAPPPKPGGFSTSSWELTERPAAAAAAPAASAFQSSMPGASHYSSAPPAQPPAAQPPQQAYHQHYAQPSQYQQHQQQAHPLVQHNSGQYQAPLPVVQVQHALSSAAHLSAQQIYHSGAVVAGGQHQQYQQQPQQLESQQQLVLLQTTPQQPGQPVVLSTVPGFQHVPAYWPQQR